MSKLTIADKNAILTSMYRSKRFNWRNIWKLRYKAYALMILLILTPILYADNSNINAIIDIPKTYKILEQNFLAIKIEKNHVSKASENDSSQSQSTNSGGVDLKTIKKIKKDTSSTPSISEGQGGNSLDKIIPKPKSFQISNFLTYPSKNVSTPIVYSIMSDLFVLKPDGTPEKQADTDSINSPIQQKLRQGVVHIANSSNPGEISNNAENNISMPCYIVGHSSNFSSVVSNYNQVFKPLESATKPGEEFFIYDQYGRELKFKVFEVLKIAENDVNEAFKDFPGRRVCTLQTSILGWKDGKLQATHRWLTRGELVVS